MGAKAHITGVLELAVHCPGELAGHEVIGSFQHQQAGGREVLWPQALAVPHQLPAEALHHMSSSER